MDANAVLRHESGLVSLWGSLVLKRANPCFKPRDLQDPLESMPGFPYCRKITPGGLKLAKGFCFCLKISGAITVKLLLSPHGHSSPVHFKNSFGLATYSGYYFFFL